MTKNPLTAIVHAILDAADHSPDGGHGRTPCPLCARAECTCAPGQDFHL